MWYLAGIPSLAMVGLCAYLFFLFNQTNCRYDDLFFWVPEFIPLRWALGEDDPYQYKPYRTRGWLLQKWDYFYYNYIEKVAQAFTVLILIVCSPLLFVIAIMWLTFWLYTVVREFLRTRMMLPCIIAIIGLFFGVFGWKGALLGPTTGFLIGIFLEIVQSASNIDHIPTITNKEQTYWTGNQATAKTAVYYEKPWCWKGWQIDRGPREDSLRKDL